MKKIKLEKVNSNGNKQIWEVVVKGSEIITTWGVEDGKMQTRKTKIAKGKNIGRANETTPEEQAWLEASTKARKKAESGYAIVEGEFAVNEKVVQKQSSTAPKPMLATDLAANDGKHWSKITYPCYVQPKLDGIRCTINIQTGEILSRSRKPIVGMEHITTEVLGWSYSELEKAGVDWIDGELYSHDLTFQDIVSITRSTKNLKSEEERKQIEFHLFDLVSDYGFEDRYEMYRKGFEKMTYVKTLEAIECNNLEEIQAAHDKFVNEGYEGTVVRNTGYAYEQKRSHNLFKHKDFMQEEYEVTGFEKEKNTDTLAACWLIDENGNEFKAKPAVTHEYRDEIWANQSDYLGMTATVKFQEYTNDGVPRFPVLIGFRDSDDMGE